MNSIFVDAMVADNNNNLTDEVTSLRKEIAEIKALMITDKKEEINF